MIYFIVPSQFQSSANSTTYFVDRNPGASSTLSLHTYAVPSGANQYSPNGVNIRDESLNISLKKLPLVDALSLDAYLLYLKNGNFTLTFPEGAKNYIVTSWSVIQLNAIYADILIQLELMYL